MRLAATLRAADEDETALGIGAFNPPDVVDDFGSGTGAFLTVRLAGIPEDMPSRLEVPVRYAEATLAGRDDTAAFLLLLLIVLLFDVEALLSAVILFCTLLLFDVVGAGFGNGLLVVLGPWLLLLLFIVVVGGGVVVVGASVLTVEFSSITGC